MALVPHLTRYVSHGVTLLGDQALPGGVTLAFTERTGGVSLPPYASLNLGDACGDDPADVRRNRRQLLRALEAEHLLDRLVNPCQVHGSEVLVIDNGSVSAVRAAQQAAREGVDAIVCTVADVPVLLCFADCVPVVLVASGAFAVIHSGWRGTVACIARKALEALCAASGCAPADVAGYIGPHIGGDDYETSPELAARFADQFGADVVSHDNHVDLGLAVRKTLVRAGVHPEALVDTLPSTASCTNRFFSYRAEGGRCGRHGAIALIAGVASEGVDHDE